MVTKKDRRKQSIKSKLVAAICMLMVSCIMVVSSTYAWFTLSTAPEVTGISTAIGANGNLEMALLPSMSTGETPTAYETVEEALAAIGNAAGSMTTPQKNTTWGNLVDLSDTSYGLNLISLFPAKLAAEDGKLSSYYLGTPIYGSDGRFMDLAKSASTAIYHNGGFGTNAFGVRAVGTSSGLSAMELAYRDALSSANDAFNKAITQTKNSASVGGSALASVAVKKASQDNPVYTERDIASLITAYSAMDGALANIEIALKQYIIAYALGNSSWTEETYLTFLNTMQAASLADLKSYASDTLDGYIDTLATMRGTVTRSLEALGNLPSNGTVEETQDDQSVITLKTYEWSTFSSYLTALANIDTMLLNGKTINYYIADNMANVNELINNMQNLVLEVNATGTPDTGLYAQMADFVDDFTSPVTIKNISYGGLNLTAGITATMKVYASADPAYLPAAKTAASTYPENAFGGGGSNISDYFGYIIDMAFRTNAAGSSLQLQTDAIDRIYDEGSENPNTMGGGSTMTFGYEDPNAFTADKLENLMGYIRVVFFDPANMDILGYARLDASTAVTATDDATGAVDITMSLKMWDPTANDNTGAFAADSIITELQQNEATAVSTLVYLDGEELTNADVANVELTGTMNIQFSSTADLQPMEYGDLQSPSEEPSEYKVTVNGIEASQKVQAGATYTANVDDFAAYIGEGKTVTGVTVKMGGVEVVGAYDAASGNVTVSNVSGDLEITVTIVETP